MPSTSDADGSVSPAGSSGPSETCSASVVVVVERRRPCEDAREGGRGDVTHTHTQTQTQNTTKYTYTHTHACARARAHTQTPMHAHARGEKRPRRPADDRTGFALRVDNQTDPRALQMPLS